MIGRIKAVDREFASLRADLSSALHRLRGA
jgi:hypothetical protein